MKNLASLLAFIFLSATAYSQSDSIPKFIEAGIAPVSYKGDLSPGYSSWGNSYHIGFRFNTRKRLNGHLNFMFGKFSSSNPFLDQINSSPNTFFKTSFIALQYDLQLYIIKNSWMGFYLSPGVGFLRYIPKDSEGNRLIDDPKTRNKNEEYGSITFMLPLQAGLSFFLPTGQGLGLQAGWVNSFSDYLDNISQLGKVKKKDNLLMYRIFVSIPLK